MRQKGIAPFLAATVIGEILLVLFCLKISYFSNPCVVINVDNLFSAQVARHVAAGEGYRTDALSLYEVALYEKKGWLSDGPPWKNTYRFPLPVLTMAALFRVFGASHFVANFLYPSLFHFLSTVTLFGLTYLMFRSGLTAFMASFIFMTNTGLLYTMLSKSEAADIFFFTLSLLVFFLWQERKRGVYALVLGIILGLTFLNRFNQGALMFVAYALIMAVRKKLTLRDFFVYSFGFAIPVVPFVVHNMAALGVPFFSSNAYFQVVENSAVSKYMNIWWKLQYSIPVDKPLEYLLSYPADFFRRAWEYIARFTLPELFKFRGSLWWWVPLLWLLFQRPLDVRIKTLGMVFGIALALHVIPVAPLGLNIRYVQFLFIPLVVVVAKSVDDWLRLTREEAGEIKSGRGRPSSRWGGMEKAVPASLSALIISLTLYGKGPMPVFLGVVSLTVLVLVLSLRRRSIAMILLFSSVVLLCNAVLTMERRYQMIDIRAYTAEECSDLNSLQASTSPDQIVLTSHPWNPSWFSRRPTLPIPEYPDEIYLLMKKYHFNLSVIYFSHMDVFLRAANQRTPISFHSYERLVDGDLPIRGFTRVERLAKGGLLLYRDSDPLEDVLNTRDIDCGTNAANSSLAYGFSQRASVDGRAVCWVLRDTGPYDRQTFSFFRDGEVTTYGSPDAEMTFLSDGKRSFGSMTMEIFNLHPGNAVSVVLNSNLFSYGDRGSFLSTSPLQLGWNVITLSLEGQNIKEGINKLGFWFKVTGNAADQQRPDLSFQGSLSGVSDRETIGVGFAKLSFSGDGG